ncbi:MAG: SDR family NAD(P)-dependent oxidoreductase, partial [Chloroflexi bacterium]|nr:SDR family NAD(P)-dependent oxidoreductase [Chloroflexota bacterium]
MCDDLSGKVALVTGASRGIGRAVAIALAQAGAEVGVNYGTRADEAHQVCREIESIGRDAMAVGADVSIASDVSRLVEAVEQQ